MMTTVDLAVTDLGEGPAVVLLPSLGRGRGDFDDLVERLAASGYRAIAVDPRGIGGSRGPLDGLSLHELAADIASLIEIRVASPAVVLGHAFGNRVARCLAADRPDLVRAVVLLAAGGLIPPSDEVLTAMGRVLDERTAPDDLLHALSVAFFAPGQDAAAWLGGWHRPAARAQAAATRSTPVEDWWDAGSAPVLVVQGLEDRCAVPDNGRRLRSAFPDRVTLVEIEDAAHALLPERPDEVAAAVLEWLNSVGVHPTVT